MGAKLLYRDTRGLDASADVLKAGVYLGRGTDCVIRTDDAMVSRTNCKIFFEANSWMVEDLKSSNGTFVNNARIQKRVLAHGDVIRCGSLQVRFVEVQDEPEAGADRSNEEWGKLEQARTGLEGKVRELEGEIEKWKSRNETEQEELRKVRQEFVAMRDQLAKLSRDKAQTDEELHAQTRVNEEMRREHAEMKKEHLQSRTRADELEEDLKTRARQLERAMEDVQRTKASADDLRNQLAELQRTKDEGWKELNSRAGELDHLRSVISEQEHILEERRIGLIAIEAATKDLRAEKEHKLREFVILRNERDELVDKLNRRDLVIEGLQEEQRRFQRLIASMETGGSTTLTTEQMKLSQELRELKVEMKRAESEVARARGEGERFSAERSELDAKIAQLEVERNLALEDKRKAEAERTRAEEARARAELLRQRLEEERNQATQARDAALSSADQYRVEADRERKRGDVPAAGGNHSPLKQKAEEAYGVVNEALSKIRSEVEKLSESSVVQLDAELRDLVSLSVERVEEAKGTLRMLREVAMSDEG